jgi:hypothetical protein
VNSTQLEHWHVSLKEISVWVPDYVIVGPNYSEKKCHRRMETASTAFSKFEMSASVGRFDFFREG